jgi:type IV pilus assembly protein PilM
MAIIKSVGDFFGLDIGTTAVRVVQLSPTGPDRWSLKHYGYAPVDIKTSTGDSSEAKHRLGEVIMTVIGQSGIKTKDVAIGLPSNKTFITVIDVPTLSEVELRGTIKYQIDQYIPMAIDEAKVDWRVLGQSLHDPSQQEVLLASTAEAYSEERMEFIENLGLNVIAAEPDPIAMIRSVLPTGARDAQMIVDVGEASTNVAITFGDAPRLVRTIPTGLGSLVKIAVQNLNIQEDQARQFILKFGLAPDRLEGQVLGAIDSTLDGFAAELTKSVKFFQTRYPDAAVTAILLAGYAGAIPQFGDYIGSKTGIAAHVADPWQKVSVPTGDQKLAAVATEFAVAVGLAQRRNIG